MVWELAKIMDRQTARCSAVFQAVYSYICSPSSPSHNTPPLLPVPTIALRVSVDVKSCGGAGGGGRGVERERDHSCKQLILWCNYVSHDARPSERLGHIISQYVQFSSSL